ncbi:hypothetical protein AB6F55_10620 [Providencia hangzhouensis]
MGKLVIGLIAVSIMMASSINTATARNYPCSGSKGGSIAVKAVSSFVMMAPLAAQNKCAPHH